MNLDELARKHGTDKCDDDHSFDGENYLHVYERYFEELRDQPINVLEIGVADGCSLRMWKEYFFKAMIFGIDINPACRRHREERIEILIAAQDDRAKIEGLARRAGGFDIVIDDASHINILTLASFEILFPLLRPGGLYAIEDTGMSWIDLSRGVHNPNFMRGEALANQKRGVDLCQSRATLDRLFGSLLFDLDMHRGELRSLHFWSNMVVMQKGGAGS